MRFSQQNPAAPKPRAAPHAQKALSPVSQSAEHDIDKEAEAILHTYQQAIRPKFKKS